MGNMWEDGLVPDVGGESQAQEFFFKKKQYCSSGEENQLLRKRKNIRLYSLVYIRADTNYPTTVG